MPGGLSSDNNIVWEYIDQHESEFIYHEIFVNESYFHGLGITLNEGDVVVDAGANIGLFSLFCLSLHPKIKICAFEPIMPIFQVLQRNLSSYFHSSNVHQHSRHHHQTQLFDPQRRFAEENLILFNAALGSRNEPQQLFYYFPSAPGESTRHIHERTQQKVQIQQLIRTKPDPFLEEILPTETELRKRKMCVMEPPDITRSTGYIDSQICFADVVTLPTAMREAFGENWTIDLLKIDVEGDEWNILVGLLTDDNEKAAFGTQSQRTAPLIHRIRQIVLEVHDQLLETESMITHRHGRLDHIVDFLQYYGFTVSVEQQLSKICEGTDYYMYIPSELNLYYVYAVHNSSPISAASAAMPPPSLSPQSAGDAEHMTMTTNAICTENHSVQSDISGTTLTSEDFDTLSAVLDDPWGDFSQTVDG